MEKNFMISIQHEGRTVYANVFEYRHSPAVYHVQFIDHIIPSHMTLHEKDGKISAETPENANPKLVDVVIEAILKNPNRI